MSYPEGFFPSKQDDQQQMLLHRAWLGYRQWGLGTMWGSKRVLQTGQEFGELFKDSRQV